MLFKFGFLTYQTLNPKLLLIILLSVCTQSYAQSNLDSLLTKIDPQKWSATVERKIGNLEDKIVAKSQKTLHRLQKQEERIYRKQLATKDSLAAQAKLAEIKTKYKELEEKLKNHSSTIPAIARQYIAHLDTLKTAFKFLASPPFSTCGEGPGMRDALSKIESLDNKMQQAEEIRKFIRDRRDQLKQQLEQLGLVKELKKCNKEVFYYSEQLKEYKQILSDPQKIEKKTIELLSKTKFF